MIAWTSTPAQLLEAGMLICFGASWPVAIFKTLRTRRTEGKSFAFLVLIFLGYLSGVAAKFLRARGAGRPEAVTSLYVLNALFVGVEIMLYLLYRPIPDRPDLSNPALP